MDKGQSLLALSVVKNARHECKLQGCSVSLPFDEIKEHEEKCTWRLVICPGSGATCTAMVPLCTVLTHAKSCSNCGTVSRQHLQDNRVEMNGYLYLPTELAFDGKNVSWTTRILLLQPGFVFFVQLSRKGGAFMIDVVMKGSKADCEEFRVNASILDAVSGKSMFEATFQPRYGFLVIQGGLARVVDNINHWSIIDFCLISPYYAQK